MRSCYLLVLPFHDVFVVFIVAVDCVSRDVYTCYVIFFCSKNIPKSHQLKYCRRYHSLSDSQEYRLEHRIVGSNCISCMRQ